MNKKAFALSFLTAVFVSRIFFFNPSRKIIGDGYDNYEYFGFQHLVKENIQNFKYPLAKTDTLRYPAGFDLSYGYDGVLAVFSGTGLGLILSQPIAYNLSIIIILALNLFFSFLLFEKLSSSFYWGFLGAVIYGLSPYVFARINSHLNLAFIGGFPLLVYSLINYYHNFKLGKVRFGSYLLIFLSILTISFGSLQYLLIFSQVILMAIVISILKSNWRREIVKIVKYIIEKDVLKLIIGSVIFLTIFLFFFSGYLKAIVNGNFIFADKTEVLSAYGRPAVTDYFLPNQYLGNFWSNFNPSSKSIEKVVSLGVIELIIFVWMLIKLKSKKIVGFLSAGFILLISFGSGWIKLLLVPEGSRLIVVFLLILTVVLTSQKPIKNKKILLILTMLLILERFSFKIYHSPLFPYKPANIVQAQAGEAVFDIPVSKYNAYYSTLPYFYNKKIVSGYFHFSADTKEAASFLERSEIIRFICQDENQRQEKIYFSARDKKRIINLLKTNGIQTIVVHKKPETLHKFYHQSCENVRYQWYNFAPERITLNNSGDFQTKTIELTNFLNLKVELFAPYSGKLFLHGILIHPSSLDQTEIILPQGELIYPEWEKNEHGLGVAFDPVKELDISAGDSLYLHSAQQTDQPIYVTVYYQYQAENENIQSQPSIEKIYGDDNIEVYTLN